MVAVFLKRGGWLLLLLGFFGAGALVVGMMNLQLGAALSGGEQITGTVSNLETRQRITQNGTHSTDYWVTVISPAGVIRQTVSDDFYRGLTQGEQITLQKAGDTVDIEPGRRSLNGLAGILLGLVLVPLTVWGTRRAVANIRRARTLRETGLCADAVITAVNKGAARIMVSLVFEDHSGKEQSTELLATVEVLEPGTRHPILYNPDDPSICEFAATVDKLAPR